MKLKSANVPSKIAQAKVEKEEFAILMERKGANVPSKIAQAKVEKKEFAILIEEIDLTMTVSSSFDLIYSTRVSDILIRIRMVVIYQDPSTQFAYYQI